MVDKYGTGQDPYCYSDTKTLINIFGIRDEKILSVAEREITTAASKEIVFSMPPYDLNYFKKIHHTLFSNIYDWAGELRSIDISKKDTRFCGALFIETAANKIFRELKNQNYYCGLSTDNFIEYIAELYGEVNMLHPFREGNGRVQRILFDHISLNAGYIVNWSITSVNNWERANIHAYAVNFEALKEIFTKATRKIA